MCVDGPLVKNVLGMFAVRVEDGGEQVHCGVT